MGWELFVSLRYLGSRRREAFVSVITVIATLGVMVGVMVLTVTLSIMTGFEEDLRARILGLHPHVRVVRQLGSAVIEEPDEVARRLALDERVIEAAPVLQSQLLISAAGQLLGVFGRGITTDSTSSTAGIAKYVVEGEVASIASRTQVGDLQLPTVMIGRELARKLGIGLGDPLRLMAPKLGVSPLGGLPRSRRFVVGALYDSGMTEYDSALVYLSIEDARVLLDTGPIATAVEGRLIDPYDAQATADELAAALGPPYWVESWTRAHRNVFEALQLEKTAYFLILLLIILVAAFTIVSTLYMVVQEKRRDIAVLKAMGAPDGAIARIFLVKGTLIGVIGTGLGGLAGYLLSMAVGRWGLIDLPEGVFYVTQLPVRIVPADFAMVMGASMVICLGACLFPAWKAARVVPVDVLRYE